MEKNNIILFSNPYYGLDYNTRGELDYQVVAARYNISNGAIKYFTIQAIMDKLYKI